ncbi:MAG: biotin carboxylase N-terminal domain-containing protein [Acidimicrobiales bacterium]
MSSDKPTSSERRPIRRLLVANRGEIARRIFRSAHDMGIETVAVFADGDADAPFVSEAHQAVSLRGRSPSESYLDVAKVLDAARVTGADAVHPGYGFLAENAEFATQVIDAGLTWVGPSPHAIASMGDKLAAKAMMVQAGVPTLPSIEVMADLDVIAAAHDIGFPVLVKATAGGGGKGMRVVESVDTLIDAVAGAQREAASSFGNGIVFLEKYLPAPRHIEIQVMGDEHGTLVHLFERECSIQRRHQKIIEEAPSPMIDPAVRSAMCDAALDAARAIGYSSAGTVEFLLDGDGPGAAFWFLEVNTRIQVEHPVTEEITGVDLVREQLRVAAGLPLSFSQDDLTITGHAIEARLYAEDPANNFLPAIGTLHVFEAPVSPAARIDSGVESGSVVGVDFDPMLAKVIVHAPTRAEAASRLALVLDTMAIAGVTTNRDFLVATLRHQAFLDGDTTTDFIERVRPRAAVVPDETLLAQAAIAAAMLKQQVNRVGTGALGFMPGGYRNSSMPPETALFAYGERVVTIRYRAIRGGTFEIDSLVDDESAGETARVHVVDADLRTGVLTIEIDGVRNQHRVTETEDSLVVQSPGGTVEITVIGRFPDYALVTVAGGQMAPMPGKVSSVHVVAGDSVQAGQSLVIMEAMKMEHTITAPIASVVSEVRCAVGDQVDNGQVLVILEEPDGDPAEE